MLKQLGASPQNSFDQKIIIDRIACPLHVLELKEGMNRIKKGETLKIISNASTVPELVAAARQIGSKVSVNDINEIFVKK